MNSAAAKRDELLNELKLILIGPKEEREKLYNSPVDEYLTGALFPPEYEQSTDLESVSEDVESDEDGDDSSSEVLVLANTTVQSATGFTFQLKSAVVTLVVKASWGEYSFTEADPYNYFLRQPKSMQITIQLSDVLGHQILLKNEAGVHLYLNSRIKNDLVFVTLSLVNRKQGDENLAPGIYQVNLSVEEIEGKAVFIAREPAASSLDEEAWSEELLYRESKEFAVGHGSAPDWQLSTSDRANKIWLEWLPAVEVKKAATNVLSGVKALKLKFLATANKKELLSELQEVPAEYLKWIEANQEKLYAITSSLSPETQKQLVKAGRKNLLECELAATRIKTGIEYLEQNPNAMQAFKLGNQIMALSMQRRRPQVEPTWFAFQLAFILLALPSTLEPNHPDREILDLIWFPTGGGKTEAYLGLAIISIVYRRLQNPQRKKYGTSVFSRYTLRMLTAQQFERASSAICAAELIRRQQPEILGEEPFRTGLFVGSGLTPNDLDEAAELIKTGDNSGQTTLPIKVCPWCGTKLDNSYQEVDEKAKLLITRCPNSTCDFTDGLPIMVIDEEIYRNPPSLIVATVDKLARMPWVPDIKNIFGLGKEKELEPDLIIQDELHLISESLGTMVALYETAIDYLCSKGEWQPKIIGSTATIKNAKKHTKDLFNREAKQFPASGIDAKDSFFYSEDLKQPGRLYLGLAAQGRSTSTTLARVTAVLAKLANEIDEPEIKDQYFTQVLYFNTLRELGTAWVLIYDQVTRYHEMLYERGEKPRRLKNVEELNSRVPSHRIGDIIEMLKAGVTDKNKSLNYPPLDFLLTSNMISVGVDIDRLGLMVMYGQPKSAAEYIQASSRVGRSKGATGIVLTLYKWSRARDRSYYEHFRAFHEAFYKYVEPTSVTPFSARARELGLPAVVFSMARMLIPEFEKNNTANKITDTEVMAEVAACLEHITKRVAAIDLEELDNTKEHLSYISDTWIRQAQRAPDLLWKPEMFKKSSLMMSASEQYQNDAFAVPNSMRDVTPPIKLVLKDKWE